MPTDIQVLIDLLGEERVLTDTDSLAQYGQNTIGISRTIEGILLPSSTEEVKSLVDLANQHALKLYPISRGKNMGYGDRLPVTDGQWIVDLGRMNRIREYNEEHGYVILEPGVTQEQLATFLLQEHAPYWMDVTGSGLGASIVGNTLEGGFGHSPRGNHREEICDVEVVLGNGSVMKTGRFPGIGPDLSGMFVQSNFGIVTAMHVRLNPIPEAAESFSVQVHDPNGVVPLMKALAGLRNSDVLTSLVHVANTVRMLMTARACPESCRDIRITDKIARKEMSGSIKVGYWGVGGCLYGSREQVAAKRKAVKAALAPLGKLNFFTENRIAFYKRILQMQYFGPLNPTLEGIYQLLLNYEPIHGIMTGKPTDSPLKHIAWRVPGVEDMGLLWFAPTASPNAEDIGNLVSTGTAVFEKYGFEMPLTITLIKPDRVVAVFNVSYNKNDARQVCQARELYAELKTAYEAAGIQPYRSSVCGMEKIRHPDAGKQETLELLKKALDPNGIISPGRYGLGAL